MKKNKRNFHRQDAKHTKKDSFSLTLGDLGVLAVQIAYAL
jgi:hypothetical protein